MSTTPSSVPAEDDVALPTDATRPGKPPVADIVLAGALVVTLGLLPVLYGSTGTSSAARLALAVVLGIVQLGALAWRRSHPELAALGVGLGAVGHWLTGEFFLPSDIAVPIALYSVTGYGRRSASRWALAAAGVGSAMQAATGAYAVGTFTGESVFIGGFFFIGCALVSLASWALGLVRRARRAEVETLADRAARLERERDQQTQIATAAERARIAREMHDIVAHSLSVVIAQADGGRYAAAADPDAATRALTTISETGRAALTDMRRILGVLRTEGSDASDLIPQPADADVHQLVGQVREAGLAVSLVDVGDPRPMPPGTGVAVYRIVQESLTNILKHAGPGVSATVLVQWAPQHLLVQVDDDGRGAAATSDGAGHGLVGMRERATMLGGSLVAGPRPGGGYRTRAEIPIPASVRGPGRTVPPPLSPAAPPPPPPPAATTPAPAAPVRASTVPARPAPAGHLPTDHEER